jgi:hypothetical protein
MVNGAQRATTLLSDRTPLISRTTKRGFTSEFAEDAEWETGEEELGMAVSLANGEVNCHAIDLRGKRAGGVFGLASVPQAISRFWLVDPASCLLVFRELQS